MALRRPTTSGSTSSRVSARAMDKYAHLARQQAAKNGARFEHGSITPRLGARPVTPLTDRSRPSTSSGGAHARSRLARAGLAQSQSPRVFTFRDTPPGTPTRPDSNGFHPLGEMCICQLCTCGNHRCPYDHAKPAEKFVGETEAQCAFPGHMPGRTTKPVKARSHGIGVGEGEFKGDTEAREAFPGHKPPPAAPRPKAKWEPNGLPFNGKTTTGDTYLGGPVAPRQAYKPPARAKLSEAPFEGKSEAQTSFAGTRAPRVRPPTPDDTPLASQKFVGTSEFQKAYPRHALPEREAKKKAAAPKSMPFTGTTSYGDIGDMEFPIDDDGGDMAKYQPPAGESLPFEGESEAQRAFPGHGATKTRKPVKARSHGIGVGEGEFKGDTEAREAFPGHKPPPAAPRPKAKWEPNGLPFNGKTTTGDTYLGGPVAPRQAYKPPARAKLSEAPFEGKSEAQTSFAGTRAPRVRPPTPDDTPLASQKFVGTSEFQKAYPRHALPEREAKKKAAAPKSMPFTGTTSYGDGSGAPVEPEHCPVLDIIRSGIDPDMTTRAGPPSKNYTIARAHGHDEKIIYKERDTRGHHKFRVYVK